MLVILTTHPIQYQIPLWQALAKDGRVPFEVWYLTKHGIGISRDKEFCKAFAWDIDTLTGYPYRFLKCAASASPTSFWQCRLVEPLVARLRASGAKALWVQGWQVLAYWQAVWAAKQLGIEVWLRGESNDLAPGLWWKGRIKEILLKQFFRRVDRFLYIGTANRRLYEKYDIVASRLHEAPYAVDNQRFQQQADALRSRRAELRQQWGIAENAFCVLFCGKFIAKKRPFDVIAAARQLIESGRMSNLHLLFVGSGDLGASLRQSCDVIFEAEEQYGLVQQLSKTDGHLPRASFAGFLNQTEISQAYVAADCLVLPSDYRETWGLVVNEALASGLPCVVSDACGCMEDLIKPFASKLWFQLGDQTRLADALKVVAEGQQELTNWASLEKIYNYSSSINTVVEIYPQ